MKTLQYLAASTDDIIEGASGAPGDVSVGEGIGIITNLLIFIVGLVAVIFIIIGGLKYATSNGDQASITSAKNTILYAIIGLVVAAMAYAIVAFVTGQFEQ